MKNFLAATMLALAVNAAKEDEVVEVAATTDIQVEELTFIEPEVIIDPVVLPPVDEGVLVDYIDTVGNEVGSHHVEIDEVHVDALEVVDEPYIKGELVSVDGEVCEKAIGHDGHYDDETGLWMLEDDMDYEPEWRCLMRPLLWKAVRGVGEAELSIENKGILEEKQALVKVHEKLVEEAQKEAEKKSCLEYIERKMSKYQECELQVLREYVQVEAEYPISWVDFLKSKKVCVEKFAEEVHDCSTMFLWSIQGMEGVPQFAIEEGDAMLIMEPPTETQAPYMHSNLREASETSVVLH